jgi:hypothetical protein
MTLQTKYPMNTKAVDTSGPRMRLRDIYKRLMRRPILDLVEVTAVSAPTITIRKIGTTVDLPNVRCIGWGAITLPTVGQYVWTLWLDGGANPIAIGVQ